VHPPTFVGVLPFLFLSRTVDLTFADSVGAAPAVSAATVDGSDIERSQSRVGFTL
jgi:hypothetical protein